MLPFLRSLSNWIRAVVLISFSENDTVGIRIASGCTPTDSKPVVIHGCLHFNDDEGKITFEVSKKLFSPVLIDDQGEVIRLFPICELESDIDVERQSPE